MVSHGFTARTVKRDGVQCGELVMRSGCRSHHGFSREFAAPGLKPSAVCVKMCAPEGLAPGDGAGYIVLGSRPGAEQCSLFCYFSCKDADDDLQVGELRLVFLSGNASVVLVRHATPGRWYDVRFEIDWEAKLMNASVDGRQSQRLCQFSRPNGANPATCVRNIKLYNYHTAAAGRWADIQFYA